MCSDRHDDDDEDEIQNCRFSASVQLFTSMDIARRNDICRMSEYVKPLSNIVTAKPQHAMEYAFSETPKLQQFNELFAQTAFEHQQLKNTSGPETPMCDRVLWIMDTPMPGFSGWRAETRIECKTRRGGRKSKPLGLPGRHVVMHICS